MHLMIEFIVTLFQTDDFNLVTKLKITASIENRLRG